MKKKTNIPTPEMRIDEYYSQVRKQKNSDDAENGNGGNFTAGFVIGALAGVAGMYLFGTKSGRKRMTEIERDWQVKYEPALSASLKEANAEGLLEQIKKVVEYLKIKTEK